MCLHDAVLLLHTANVPAHRYRSYDVPRLPHQETHKKRGPSSVQRYSILFVLAVWLGPFRD